MRLVLVIALAAVSALAVRAETTFTSGEYGFSLKPPVQERWAGSGMVASFMLPPVAGFSDNVNVTIQEFAGTLADYDQLTRKQFEQNAITLVAAQQGKDVLIYEYAGNLQGRALHWYSRAYSKDGKIYLITATCMESRWEENKKMLIEAVDSFAIKK